MCFKPGNVYGCDHEVFREDADITLCEMAKMRGGRVCSEDEMGLHPNETVEVVGPCAACMGAPVKGSIKEKVDKASKGGMKEKIAKKFKK